MSEVGLGTEGVPREVEVKLAGHHEAIEAVRPPEVTQRVIDDLDGMLREVGIDLITPPDEL